MIYKIKACVIIAVLFASLSCKKQGNGSYLTFSPNCDFSGSKVEVVDKLKGSLRYIDNISNHSTSGYKFVIESSGRLPMVVCNMPSSFEMEKDKTINVTFSGRVVIIPDEADAISTDIELSYLKFE